MDANFTTVKSTIKSGDLKLLCILVRLDINRRYLETSSEMKISILSERHNCIVGMISRAEDKNKTLSGLMFLMKMVWNCFVV